jgi:PAS domain S-box-containing protein
MILFIGYFTITLLKYNTRQYVNKINEQNNLLRQREKLLTKTNQRLLKQSNFLNLVTDSFSHPFYVVDANSFEILMANKSFFKHYNLPEDFDLKSKKCFELTHHSKYPCEGNEHPCPLHKVKETGSPVTEQHTHKDATGNQKIVEITAFPVFDETSGEIKQIIEYNVDITNKVKEQQLLAEKEERLRSIITASPNGVAVTDLNGNITFASKKTAALLQIDDPRVLIGRNVLEFLHPDEKEDAAKAIENLQKSNIEFVTHEFRTLRADGSVYFQETNASLLCDKAGKPYAMVLISRDITQRKITEQRLLNLNDQLKEKSEALEELNKSLEKRIKKEVEISREKDRMLALHSRQAAMGEMIGNIAHQWRQPLNTINLIIFDLLEAHKHGELNDEYLLNSYNKINRVVQNMSVTIDDFRNFFKPNKEKKVFNINTIIDQALSFVEAGLKANQISINVQKNENTLILGYPNELLQTIINIINNARDALSESISENKSISIKCHSTRHQVVIKICNNGGIISDENLEKIFDPYFTTKPEGQGTGLGLFISKTIIEKNMKGIISVQNSDNGVCFLIELPNYEEEATAKK